MSHTAEPPVRCVNAAAYNPELAVPDFLAQKVVFSIKRLFMKASKAVEDGFLKQHEHSRAKWLHQQRSVLCDVVGKVKDLIASGSLRAPDVCCDAV